ncbi:MAG: AI-2E family transporter [Methanosarcinales archaeon]|nr:AI-2E family transporter [Methanosarcinales archaeon]
MNSRDRFNRMAGAALIFVLIAVIFITKEFLTIILLSAFFAYILHPVYSFFLRTIRHKQLSAFLSILLVFAAFGFFALTVIDAMATEISKLSASPDAAYLAVSGLFDSITSLMNQYMPDAVSSYTEQISRLLVAPVSWAVPKIAGILSIFAANVPVYLVQFGVSIMLTYYLLIDGVKGLDTALDLLPEKGIMQHFLHELNGIYNSLFNVYLITCILTGIIAAVGFFILGISYPLVWGMVTAVFALLPIIGPGTVYFPMSLYFLLTQDYITAVLLLLFGIIFLDVIPGNVIRPRLAMKGASIHPVINLLSFTAPLFVIGPMGVIVGPALYGFLLAAYRTKINMAGNDTQSDMTGDVDDADDGIEYVEYIDVYTTGIDDEKINDVEMNDAEMNGDKFRDE